MFASLNLRLSSFFRASLPSGLTVLFVLAANLPYGSQDVSRLFPLLPLVSVFYWSAYRPETMPSGAAFLIGFLADVLSGMPLGLWALTFVLLQLAAVSQSQVFVDKPFQVGWFGFALLAAGAIAFYWLGASLYFLRFYDPMPVLLQLAMTVAVYPVVAELFGLLQRRYMR